MYSAVHWHFATATGVSRQDIPVQNVDHNSVSFPRVFLFPYYFDQGRINAGADGAAAPGPPLYQVNKVIKVIDIITFKN